MSKSLLSVNRDGNKKLKNNDNVRFLIFNIPAVVTCPFRTKECENCCYAKKAEKVYPDCLPCRERNLDETRKIDFVENMINEIDSIINSKRERAYSKAKTIVFRIHESGDFYNKAYTEKWLEIARHFEKNPGKNGKKLVFMAYTKSVSFFIGEKIPSNMVVRFSLWDDTKPEESKKAADLNLPTYTAVESFENYKGIKCHCVDCGNCGLCWNKKADHIACEIH